MIMRLCRLCIELSPSQRLWRSYLLELSSYGTGQAASQQ